MNCQQGKSRTGILFLGIFIFLWVTGCHLGLTSYRGTVVDPLRQIPIKAMGTPQPETWATRDIIVTYQYGGRQQNTLDFTAALKLNNATKHFSTINHLWVYLHFIDRSGTVLDSRQIFNAGYRISSDLYMPENSYQFNLPAGAVALAFSYSGQVRDGGGGGGGARDMGGGDATTWDFWLSP